MKHFGAYKKEDVKKRLIYKKFKYRSVIHGGIEMHMALKFKSEEKFIFAWSNEIKKFIDGKEFIRC